MTRRQRRALDPICETFVAGAGGAGLPAIVLELTRPGGGACAARARRRLASRLRRLRRGLRRRRLVAAAVFAGAGFDVAVLEAGGHFEDADFGGRELDAYRRMYRRSRAPMTTDGGIGLLAGSCLGGTTVVNYTTSFRTRGSIRAECGEPFASDAFSGSLDAVEERLGVNTDEGKPASRDEVMRRGLERLGRHVAPMPRNATRLAPEPA